jgi:hypothetical protein
LGARGRWRPASLAAGDGAGRAVDAGASVGRAVSGRGWGQQRRARAVRGWPSRGRRRPRQVWVMQGGPTAAGDGDNGARRCEGRWWSGLTGAEDRPVRAAALGAEAAVAVQDEKMKLSREVNCVVHMEREVARCYENFKNVSYQGNVPLCIFVG